MRSETYMSKINLQRGKLTVENRKSREKKRICSEVREIRGVSPGEEMADNHTTTPPLSFYKPDALPATQPTVSKH